MPIEFDFAFLLPFALALLATGAFAGTLAGLLGVGGGIVIVPILCRHSRTGNAAVLMLIC